MCIDANDSKISRRLPCWPWKYNIKRMTLHLLQFVFNKCKRFHFKRLWSSRWDIIKAVRANDVGQSCCWPVILAILWATNYANAFKNMSIAFLKQWRLFNVVGNGEMDINDDFRWPMYEYRVIASNDMNSDSNDWCCVFRPSISPFNEFAWYVTLIGLSKMMSLLYFYFYFHLYLSCNS